ncbi:MAG: hypothetical protein HYS55_03685 [Candidatus Omnitrophica bacterium]|nr:hypothetical protein [Candidatus Omnitrophota bacterium]
MEISKRTFIYLVIATIALLLYVHEQVSIYQVSYDIGKKERELARLTEEYKTFKFRVARLRSPHVLSERMKRASLDLAIPEDQEVIRILKLRVAAPETREGKWSAPFQFLSLLHFVREAQAKTARD